MKPKAIVVCVAGMLAGMIGFRILAGENRGAPIGGSCTFPIDSTAAFELSWVEVPSGTFVMGACAGDPHAHPDEKPAHEVAISRPFMMSVNEVTRRQFLQFMRASGYKGGVEASKMQPGDQAMNYVSWIDATAFCAWVTLCASNAGTLPAGYSWRLPTEAEWEYACRAGSTGIWCFGSNEELLGDYAWYFANSDDSLHPVGQKNPNAFGLHDMHGNVWEWCMDEWFENYLGAPTDGGARKDGKPDRGPIMRGGSWFGFAENCRSSIRSSSAMPEGRNYFIGFRILCAPRGNNRTPTTDHTN